MGLNDTPSAVRTHIGFFGRRNAGKSSVVNAVTNQNLAVVSDVKGTTTDPVYKSMELLPLGPVMIIDTPGFDDEGTLGELRVKKTKQILNKTDIAVLVVDSTEGLKECDNELIELFKKKEIPYVIVFNKSDLKKVQAGENSISVSAHTKENINELKELIASLKSDSDSSKSLLGDLISPLDTVILITPIDESAPKGRMILPQQQAIRDVIDHSAFALVVQDTEYKQCLESLKSKPSLVVTDSQVFQSVSAQTPADVRLTSFSILMARFKGFLDEAVRGAYAIDNLSDNSTVLISEGCTHHRQCNDIGTVKLPAWLRRFTGKNLNFKTTSGTEFPDSLDGIDLVVHCGGCMLNEREMRYRMKTASDLGVPMTNYGTAIAHMNSILERSLLGGELLKR